MGGQVTEPVDSVRPRAAEAATDDPHDGIDLGVTIQPIETFDAFYGRQFAGLVALARALAGPSGVAEDLAQEAMMVAYRRWDEVSLYAQPEAWVRRVCSNLATSAFRRRQAELRALVRLGSRRNDPIEISTSSEAFWAQVRRLPRRQAEVVALRYVFDLEVTEIGATLGIAEGTVKAHLSRARETLATRLDRESRS